MNIEQKTSVNDVRVALRDAGCESYVEDLDNGEDVYLKGVAQDIDKFCVGYENRYGETPKPLELLNENPEKGAAFIQWIAGEKLDVDVAIMIWRILSGAEILSLNYEFQKDQEAILEIELGPLRGERIGPDKDPPYRSTNPSDFRLLAEFRMLTFAGKPNLVGLFHPIR